MTSPSEPNPKFLKQTTLWATELARKAGKITLRYFGKSIEVLSKQDESPVTAADRETEVYLRREILKRFPDHALIGEEFGNEAAKGNSPWSWTIDPIDGTKSFITGVPMYTVLLALQFRGEPVAGVVHSPASGETVWAWNGGGCWFRKASGWRSHIRTASLRTPLPREKAWVMVTDPGHLLRLYPKTSPLLTGGGPLRTWGDAYGYLLLVTGRVDAMVDARMNPWDVAPLVPLVREAGGVISDLEGKPGAGDSCLAASPELHRALLDYFRA